MKEANGVVPHTHQETVKTVGACGRSGRISYERRRARAMVLPMRYGGLRISDVVTLSRDHFHASRLEKRAVKNNRLIRVEPPSSVLEAIELLPHPQGAAQDKRR